MCDHEIDKEKRRVSISHRLTEKSVYNFERKVLSGQHCKWNDYLN